jgi:hypothetical protein
MIYGFLCVTARANRAYAHPMSILPTTNDLRVRCWFKVMVAYKVLPSQCFTDKTAFPVATCLAKVHLNREYMFPNYSASEDKLAERVEFN